MVRKEKEIKKRIVQLKKLTNMLIKEKPLILRGKIKIMWNNKIKNNKAEIRALIWVLKKRKNDNKTIKECE